jgi:hypothetical protein
VRSDPPLALVQLRFHGGRNHEPALRRSQSVDVVTRTSEGNLEVARVCPEQRPVQTVIEHLVRHAAKATAALLDAMKVGQALRKDRVSRARAVLALAEVRKRDGRGREPRAGGKSLVLSGSRTHPLTATRHTLCDSSHLTLGVPGARENTGGGMLYYRVMKPVRIPLFGFPDVILHAEELAVKKNSYYPAAKGGDADAADLLVAEMIRRDCIPNLMMLMESRQARLLPIHALESKGVNEIPAAMAKLLSGWLGFPVEASIVQANTVGHTGASGFQRLANQACFVGEVERGERYIIVDDFVGQGGTLANLIGSNPKAVRPWAPQC